jgi:mannitol/fructose-specific phosphotransferase system IIA component (Ntr-type)
MNAYLDQFYFIYIYFFTKLIEAPLHGNKHKKALTHLSQLFTLKPAREAIKNMVQHKIKNVLNCSNRL